MVPGIKVSYVKDFDMEWAEGVAVAVITQAIKDWVKGEQKGKIYGHTETRNAHSYETARSFLFGDGEWQEVLTYWGAMVRVDIEDIRDLARVALYRARMPRQRYRIYYRGKGENNYGTM